MSITIESSWQKVLASEFEKEYFKLLTVEVRKRYLEANRSFVSSK